MFTQRIITKIATGKLRKSFLFVLCVSVILWMFFMYDGDVSARIVAHVKVVNDKAISSLQHADSRIVDKLDTQRGDDFESIGKYGKMMLSSF